ncbi:MAG: choice-of-anchor Q domain-containing protein [Planctomycetota bacterium]
MTTDGVRPRGVGRPREPMFQALESRVLLSTFVVDTLDDVVANDGLTSLREAVDRANVTAGDDVIAFESRLFADGPRVVTLSDGPLVLTNTVHVMGPGADRLTIDGDGAVRVLDFRGAAIGSIVSGLTVTGGVADEGGGIRSVADSFTLDGVYLHANRASVRGGGFFGAGDGMVIRNSTFGANESDGSGGGAYLVGGAFSIVNSTLSGNIAQDAGGGVVIGAEAVASIVSSTFVANVADQAASGTSFGGAVAISDDERAGSSIVLESTIFESNAASGSPDAVWAADSTDINLAALSHNLFSDASSALGLTDGENNNIVGRSALLEPALALGNGPIPVHVPMPMSPVLDAGSNSATLDTDQRGRARVSGGAIDIGAVEYQAPQIDDVTTFGNTFTALIGPRIFVHVLPGESEPGASLSLYLDSNDDGLFDASELVQVLPNGSASDPTRYVFAFDLDGSIVTPGSKRFFLQAADEQGLLSEPVELNLEMVASTRTVFRVQVGTEAGGVDRLIQRNDVLFSVALVGDRVLDDALHYYIDANGNGLVDAEDRRLDVSIVGSSSDGEWASISSEDIGHLDAGLVDIIVVVEDRWGFRSAPFTRTVRVFPSEVAAFTAPAAGATDEAGELVSLIINEFGDPVVHEFDGSSFSLVERADAPLGFGDAELWTDPKDGLIYGAYPSIEGLVLLRRDASGAWSVRRLGQELGVTEDDNVVSVTQFTSAAPSGRVSVIAGASESGSLVVFEEQVDATGVSLGYELTRVSDSLASNGVVTPMFSELISYRPSWDAWHLAGIDLDGDVISVWRAPGGADWRLDNLTAITGGDRIERGLAVILTSWNGISITGLNGEGEVVSSWWVPQFGGDWRRVNLTESFDGPRLTDAGLTSFYTPWNAQNYVGINEQGQVTAYWWAPSFAGAWRVDTLTDPPRSIFDLNLDRGLTAHVADDGTLNVLGVSDRGGVLRNWWSPFDDGGWRVNAMYDFLPLA